MATATSMIVPTWFPFRGPGVRKTVGTAGFEPATPWPPVRQGPSGPVGSVQQGAISAAEGTHDVQPGRLGLPSPDQSVTGL